MKKIFLTAALGAIACTAANAQLRFGAEAGLHLGNVVAQYPDGNGGTETVDAKPNMGLRAGLLVDIGLTDNLSFQPGVHFAMKGFRTETEESYDILGTKYEVESQEKLNLNYVEIPLNFQYAFGEDRTGFFIGVGPYVGIGLSGKYAIDGSVKMTTGGQTVSEEFDEEVDVEFGNDEMEDMYRRLDLGIGLNAGYMLPMGVFVRAYGQYGFSNMYNVDVDDYKSKNYGFGLTVGYMLTGN